MKVEEESFIPEIREEQNVFEKRIETCPELFLVFIDEETDQVGGYLCAEFCNRIPSTKEALALGHSPINTASRSFIYISSFAILPEYRGNGLGEKLWNEALDYFTELTSDTLKAFILLVNSKWKNAAKIYDKSGFFTIRLFQDFFGDGGNGILKIRTHRITFYEAGGVEVLKASFKVAGSDDIDLMDKALPIAHQYYNAYVQTLDASYLEDTKIIYDYVLETVSEDAIWFSFERSLILHALKKGFYPMSLECFGMNFLAIKHHLIKLNIAFDRFRVPKNTKSYIKKYFSDYTITFNRDFQGVMQGINKAYPDTWLCPELVAELEAINRNPTDEISVDSVEIWNGDKLVAGEIGFITGNVYASLSGYHTENNIGTVQMAVLGLYLKENGFAYWDLGMSIPYKYRFGAEDCDREKQAQMYQMRSPERKILSSREIKLSEFLKYL